MILSPLNLTTNLRGRNSHNLHFKAEKNRSSERSSDLPKVTQQRNDSPRMNVGCLAFRCHSFWTPPPPPISLFTPTFKSPFHSFSSSLVQSLPPYAHWNLSILACFSFLICFCLQFPIFLLQFPTAPLCKGPITTTTPKSVSEAQIPPLNPYHRFCGFLWRFWGSHSGGSLQKVRLSMAEDLGLQPSD